MIVPSLFSEHYEQFRGTVRRFLEKEVAPHHAGWDDEGFVERD